MSAAAVEPWVETIGKLAFDERFYQDAVTATRTAARMYAREELTPRYADFFRRTLAAPAKR